MTFEYVARTGAFLQRDVDATGAACEVADHAPSAVMIARATSPPEYCC